MKNKILKLSGLLCLSAAFSGCLKDDGFDDNQYQSLRGSTAASQKVLQLAIKTDQNEQTAIVAYNPETTARTLDLVPVTISGGFPAEKDIHIVLDTVDRSYITNYNTVHGTSYVVPPASKYTIISKNLTIPKGQSRAVLQIRVTLQDFLGDVFAIPFRIVSNDAGYSIASARDTGIIGITIKNKYDAYYSLRVRMRAPGNDRPTVNVSVPFEWGGDVHLNTISTNTNDLFDDWGFGQAIQPIQTNTFAFSAFGSTQPRFTFDPATDQVTQVINAFPNPANGRAFQIDPAKPSYYDPASKNAYLHFIMTQPGFQPLFISDTLTYNRER